MWWKYGGGELNLCYSPFWVMGILQCFTSYIKSLDKTTTDYIPPLYTHQLLWASPVQYCSDKWKIHIIPLPQAYYRAGKAALQQAKREVTVAYSQNGIFVCSYKKDQPSIKDLHKLIEDARFSAPDTCGKCCSVERKLLEWLMLSSIEVDSGVAGICVCVCAYICIY